MSHPPYSEVSSTLGPSLDGVWVDCQVPAGCHPCSLWPASPGAARLLLQGAHLSPSGQAPEHPAGIPLWPRIPAKPPEPSTVMHPVTRGRSLWSSRQARPSRLPQARWHTAAVRVRAGGAGLGEGACPGKEAEEKQRGQQHPEEREVPRWRAGRGRAGGTGLRAAQSPLLAMLRPREAHKKPMNRQVAQTVTSSGQMWGR